MKFLVLVMTVVMVSSAPVGTGRIPKIGESVVAPYSYGYEVQDVDTMNFQNKAEIRDENGNVYGSYSVLMPDDIIYTTSYNVTGDSGYVARLTLLPIDISNFLTNEITGEAKTEAV